MKNIFGLLALLAILVLSCRPKPLKIDIPPVEQEVVVFSQLIPDRIMTVVLTKTMSALDFSQDNGQEVDSTMIGRLLEKDAMVSVGYLGNEYELHEVAPGVYSSLEILQHPYKEYHLKIKTQAGKNLSATTTMLPKVDFDTIMPIIKRSATDTVVTVQLKFKDLPEKNWYMINFYKQNALASSGLNFDNYFSSGSSDLSYTILLDDVLAENGYIENTIELNEMAPTDSMVVSLANISETYFQYLEGRKKAGTLLTEITKEPIHSPSNIEGGRGFFNTHFPSLRFYDLNDF